MLEIWTYVGFKMVVTHFVTQFTHVSRHFGVNSRKQKQMFIKNCLKTWSQIRKKKGSMCSQIFF